MEDYAVRADIGDTRLVDRARLTHRLAAGPQLDDARVTGCGHRSWAEVGAEEHGVFVQPGDGGFRFLETEAIGHKSPARHIELPHDHGIASPTGEMEQTALERGAAFGALPNPVFVLLGSQPIEVQQHLPRGRGPGVIGDARAAPQTLWMLRVLPEVEHI